jgi:amino acid transporter
MGAVSSVLILFNYSLTDNANEIFWTILAFSFVIFLLPYLWLFPAAIKLRFKDKDKKRPYTVPGGVVGLNLFAGIGELFILASILLLFVPDDSYNLMVYYPTLIIGTIITTIIGIFIYNKGRKEAKKVELVGNE